jgi:hypothetical protein
LARRGLKSGKNMISSLVRLGRFRIPNGGFSGLARRAERRDHCIVITAGKEAP